MPPGVHTIATATHRCKPHLPGLAGRPDAAIAPLTVLAPTAQHAHAERNADERRARGQLALVAAQVAAPVGDVGDLSAQAVQRDGQLHPIGLDRAADLRGRALGHQPPLPAGPGPSPLLTVCLIFFASSIAISGTGGAPFFTAFAASSPASAPSSSRITAIAKKPQK